MNISTNSWHYRFNAWNNANFEWKFAEGRYTTCTYIRGTLCCLLSFPLKILIMALAALWLLSILISMFVVPGMIFMGAIPPVVPTAACVTAWILVCVFLVTKLVNQVGDVIQHRNRKSKSRSKAQPNVFVQAIIDKHNKICTRVTAE